MQKEKKKDCFSGNRICWNEFCLFYVVIWWMRQLVLIDVNKEKAIGEAMDLQHGLPYAQHKIDIKAGDYDECKMPILL